MRIAILAHNLRVGGGASVGQNILAALGRIAPEHEYFVSIPAERGYHDLCRVLPNCQVEMYVGGGGVVRRLRYDRYRLSEKVRAFRPDVVLGLGNMGVRRPGCPAAILVHNSHRIYPTKHAGPIPLRQKINRWLRSLHLRLQLPRMDMVFCQTETMRRRFIKTYRFCKPVKLFPNAVSTKTLQSSAKNRPAVFAELEGRFVLFCLTGYAPHKNLEGIVKTFAQYRDELQDVTVILTVCPEQGKAARRFLRSISRNRLASQIKSVGVVPQTELAGYFEHSDGMFFPTLLESFSGTYIEAMHFGCPTITSDLDFAHEICGDAAIYCDPWSPESIKNTILRLKNEPHLREDLVEKGKSRLQTLFRSWDDIVAIALHELEELVSSNGGQT